MEVPTTDAIAAAVRPQTEHLVGELAPRVADLVLSRVSATLVEQVASSVTAAVQSGLTERVRAATADSELRISAHVDEAILALAEALLRRRRSSRGSVLAGVTDPAAAVPEAEPAEELELPAYAVAVGAQAAAADPGGPGADGDVEDAPQRGLGAAAPAEDEDPADQDVAEDTASAAATADDPADADAGPDVVAQVERGGAEDDDVGADAQGGGPHGDDRAAQDRAAQDLAAQDPVAEDPAAEDLVPEDLAPEDTAAQDLAPEDLAPEDTAPEDTASEDLAPEDTASEELAPEDAAPEEDRLDLDDDGQRSQAPSGPSRQPERADRAEPPAEAPRVSARTALEELLAGRQAWGYRAETAATAGPPRPAPAWTVRRWSTPPRLPPRGSTRARGSPRPIPTTRPQPPRRPSRMRRPVPVAFWTRTGSTRSTTAHAAGRGGAPADDPRLTRACERTGGRAATARPPAYALL